MLQIDMNKLVFEEKTIMGSSCYRDDHEELLSALDSGSIKLEGEFCSVLGWCSHSLTRCR